MVPFRTYSFDIPAGMPGRAGRMVWLLSSARMPGFSSMQITIALSGGFMYRPTTSVSFSLNSESLLSLKERCLWGWSP